ncbi:MAG: ribbon-helix-helix protein, CopG family [Candidatus Doudnabacteria bacterium]|nr:ribbon-helix-helix protein, CopG family [Candidatus Doudnabacteria bacterium]
MKSQTFNIALPRELVKKIDQAARKEYRNRSELIRESVRIYLQDMEEWEEIFSYGKKQAKKVGIKTERDIDRIVSEFRHGKSRS